jgi:alpha-glucosidase
LEAINRKFIELRYKLLPYIYAAFWEHYRYGFPILRPVVMLEQDNPINKYREDEFTFGDKILVCPVLEEGAISRKVYLPIGTWFNYWTYETLQGGEEHLIDAPLDSMPIFVKAGSVIPEYPVMQHTKEFEVEEMTFQIYYSNYEVNSFYFEDHGDTFAYEQDIYMEKKFVVNGDKKCMTIKQSIEGLFTPRYETYELKIIGLPFKPSKVLIDGNVYAGKLEFDELKRISLKTPKHFKQVQVVK